MRIEGAVAVVTGGGSGIGAALCDALAAAGARHVAVVDVDGAAARRVAGEVHGSAHDCDVSDGAALRALISSVIAGHGRIDVYCSNAGVGIVGGEDADDAGWQRSWDVNVRAHVHAARALMPHMLARGGGSFVGTVSAAGLLNHVQAAPYAASKAAALSFLEWLAITYGDRGVHIAALCPQGVRTPMLLRESHRSTFLLEGAIEPGEVARAAITAIEDERFLVLPHPEVRDYAVRRAQDHDRWIAGMRRVRDRAAAPGTRGDHSAVARRPPSRVRRGDTLRAWFERGIRRARRPPLTTPRAAGGAARC